MKIIIVGGGQIGGYIANLLLKNNHNVTVIENRERSLQALKNNGISDDHILVGDGTDAFVLEKSRRYALQCPCLHHWPG